MGETALPLDHVLVCAGIKHVRCIASLRPEHSDSIILDELANWTLLVIEVAKNARAGWTNLNASRPQSLGDTVITPSALVAHISTLIEEARAIRTGLHAILTTDAVGVIDYDHAVVGLVSCAGRAHLHAGRMRAVIAKLRQKKSFFDIRIFITVGKTIFPLCV